MNESTIELTMEGMAELLARTHALIEIPEGKRSGVEDMELASGQEFLKENCLTIYKELTDGLFQNIRFRLDEESLLRYENALASSQLIPPVVKQTVTTEDINEAIPQLYQGITTIGGMLEELEPQYQYAAASMERAEKLFKAVFIYKTDWRGKAIYELMIPEDIFVIMNRVGEVVQRLKLRKSRLDSAHSIISRLITLRQQTPTHEIRRPEGPALTNKPASRFFDSTS